MQCLRRHARAHTRVHTPHCKNRVESGCWGSSLTHRDTLYRDTLPRVNLDVMLSDSSWTQRPHSICSIYRNVQNKQIQGDRKKTSGQSVGHGSWGIRVSFGGDGNVFQDLEHLSCCLAVGSSRPFPWAGLTCCARSKGSVHTSKGGADWL